MKNKIRVKVKQIQRDKRKNRAVNKNKRDI